MTIRHVGLVALEALLVAIIVWVATMALAGASQNGGFIGSASAGDARGAVTVDASGSDGRIVLTAERGAGSWAHVACRRGTAVVGSRWVRLDEQGAAVLRLAPSSGPTACVAEHGYFSANGKWRVIGVTNFNVPG
jgi:hypothetical protein